MTTEIKRRRREGATPQGVTGTEPPYSVVLYNDWENSVTRVVRVLLRVFPGMSVKRAVAVMWEAHVKNRVVVKSCHKELADLYEERLLVEGLKASAEPGL